MTKIIKTDTGYGLDGLYVHLAPTAPGRGYGWFLTCSWGAAKPVYAGTAVDARREAHALLRARAAHIKAIRSRVVAAAGPDVDATVIERLVQKFSK